MRKISRIISFITVFILVTNCHQQFKENIEPWNLIATIEGQFNKNGTLFSFAKCDPCDFIIVIYRDVVQLLIDNPQDGKTDKNIHSYSFRASHFKKSLWDFDHQKLIFQSKKNQTSSIQRTNKKGIQWSYDLVLPTQGLILKGYSQFLYEKLIPIVSLVFSVLIFIVFPISGQARKQQSREIPRRTPLVSLVIMSQMQHLILVQIITLMIKFIIYEQTFLVKSFWYILFMIPFSLIVLQIIHIYDAVKVRYLQMTRGVKSARIRDVALILTFFVGIYAATTFLLLISKEGIMVFCYFALYLSWHIFQSLFIKAYPHLHTTFYYFILLAYQMMLANFYPLFWFGLQTRTEILSFWIILIAIFLIGSLCQKFLIRVENVNQVIFEESKNIEMPGSAKNTQLNLQT